MSEPTPLFPFRVDALREEDIPAVMEIERRSFSLPWREGIYRYELRFNSLSFYRTIRSTSPQLPRVIAYGGIWLYVPEAHVSTIAVHPDFRGLHFGAWLLAVLLVESARRGAEEASLEVRVSNVKAQRLYLSFGFQVVGKRLRYYSDNREDALIMTLRPLRIGELEQRLFREERIARERWSARGAYILATHPSWDEAGPPNSSTTS